jgi:hypothetical protein
MDFTVLDTPSYWGLLCSGFITLLVAARAVTGLLSLTDRAGLFHSSILEWLTIKVGVYNMISQIRKKNCSYICCESFNPSSEHWFTKFELISACITSVHTWPKWLQSRKGSLADREVWQIITLTRRAATSVEFPSPVQSATAFLYKKFEYILMLCIMEASAHLGKVSHRGSIVSTQPAPKISNIYVWNAWNMKY